MPFRLKIIAIANVCGFESICQIQRLQDQSHQSQSLVMCYNMNTRNSSVNPRGWEREREPTPLDLRAVRERKPRELTKHGHRRALAIQEEMFMQKVRMSSPLEGEKYAPTYGQNSRTGVPAVSNVQR